MSGGRAESAGPFWRAVSILEAGVGPVFPSAVAVVRHRGDVVFHHAVGSAEPDTIYDLASLTKPMVCATLFAQGHARLSQRFARLLGHAFGMPAHIDLKPDAPRGTAAAIAEITARVRATPRVVAEGQRAIYSDLGYMLLGWELEALLGEPLDVLFDRIARDFELPDTGYRPALRPRIAPTEDCPVRQRVIRGEVHDLNAWYLGGVAGHAGLFGTAADVARWAQGWVDAYRGGVAPVHGSLVERLWTARAALEPTTWRLGFDTVTPGASSAGTRFGPRSVGHLGFTGTSVWIDPDRDLVCVLLSNRVHPTVHPNPEIKRLRPAFHDAVVRSLGH